MAWSDRAGELQATIGQSLATQSLQGTAVRSALAGLLGPAGCRAGVLSLVNDLFLFLHLNSGIHGQWPGLPEGNRYLQATVILGDPICRAGGLEGSIPRGLATRPVHRLLRLAGRQRGGRILEKLVGVEAWLSYIGSGVLSVVD